MSSNQSVCIANHNGVYEADEFDMREVVIDGKIDANGNKISSTSSSDEETISSTSTGSCSMKDDDESDDEMRLKTRYIKGGLKFTN